MPLSMCRISRWLKRSASLVTVADMLPSALPGCGSRNSMPSGSSVSTSAQKPIGTKAIQGKDVASQA